MTDLNAYLTTLHAALPPHPAAPLLLFSGHSDPRSMSTLAAQRAEYQTSQQQQGNQGSGSSGATAPGGVRWSTADDRVYTRLANVDTQRRSAVVVTTTSLIEDYEGRRHSMLV